MRRRSIRLGLLVAVATLTLALAGCSSSSSAISPGSGSATSTPTTTGQPLTPTSTTSTAAAVNLPVTDQIRTQLVAAGAALQEIPVAQFSGLAPGLTYYAKDRVTDTYWAGARLVASPTAEGASPSRAQVSTQDDGSYYLFSRPADGAWTAHPAGNVGPETPCSVVVPSEVLQVWGWTPGSCRPAGI